MCDFVAGSVIASFPSEGAISTLARDVLRDSGHPSIARLSDRLGEHKRSPQTDHTISNEYELVQVPFGHELAVSAELSQRFLDRFVREVGDGNDLILADYVSKPGRGFLAVPNGNLSLQQQASSSGPVSFELSSEHTNYLKMIGASGRSAVTNRHTVALIDSGFSASLDASAKKVAPNVKVIRRHNLTDDSMPNSVDDVSGHGTLAATLIASVTDQADFVICKIFDGPEAAEWDLIAALALVENVDVVNIAAGTSLAELTCAKCGRLSHSSRSLVLERFISHIAGDEGFPLVVTAVGNDSVNAFKFPARYQRTVAGSSVASNMSLSSFSNYGGLDHQRKQHLQALALPGGQENPTKEAVANSVGQVPQTGFWGTSFASAYASGIIVQLLAENPKLRQDVRDLVADLQMNADKGFPGYKWDEHGNGLMQLP